MEAEVVKVVHVDKSCPKLCCERVMVAKEVHGRTSLVVQWLRLHALNAEGPGSIPGQGSRSHMPQLKDSARHN